jgi:MarR family transcriptional regulator, transcriptional regulator for hemolysin
MMPNSAISPRSTKTDGEPNVAAWRLPTSATGRTTIADLVEDDFLLPLFDLARHLNAYVDWLAHAHGMTRAQLIIIARLERQPDVSEHELARLAEVAPTTLVRLIDGLETLGIVKRCSDPTDRQMWLRLTPEAAPLLRDIKHLRANLRSLATEGIKPAVLKTTAFGLRRMEALLLSVDRVAAGIA